MVALETHGIILVLAEALRLVSDGFKFVFIGSSAQETYKGDAHKLVLSVREGMRLCVNLC